MNYYNDLYFYSYETGNINIPPSGNSVQPFMSGIIVGLKK